MPRKPEQDVDRIAELEAELRQRDDKIKQLTTDLGEARELVDQMREQTEEANRVHEQWIEVFDMQLGENGVWLFDPKQSELWNRHEALLDEHHKLLRDWNKFVRDYNARISPREMGRPIAASAAQQSDVLKRHRAKESLRVIARATGLGLSTVRTIVSKGRTTKRTNELRRKAFDRLRAAAYRARKRQRDRLPNEITELQKTGAALIKAAKGIGR